MANQFWNVQPYRWLNELRSNYTEYVMYTSRKTADEVAIEATQWMRDNAPWRDRDITRGRGKNKVVVVKAGTARRLLKAEVLVSEEEKLAYDQGLDAARKQESKLLAKMNKERQQASYEERKINEQRVAQKFGLKIEHNTPTSTGRTATEIKALLLKRVPSHLSPITAFKKQFEKDRSFVASIRFSGTAQHQIWLEIAHQGRYSIIGRAVQHWKPKLTNRLRSTLNLKQFRGKGEIPASAYLTEQERFAETVRGWEFVNPGRTYEPWSPPVKTTKAGRRTYRRKGPQKRGRYNTQG